MVPISARLPDDLYAWLSTLQLENATTLSDKLRVAVAHLKRAHDGDSDYGDALAMYRDLGRGTREQVGRLEQDLDQHSEVLAAFMEHLPPLIATLHAAQLGTVDDARRLEAVLVKRALQLTESLMRQAVTREAAAYDPAVVTQNAGRLLELARLIPQSNKT